MTISFSIVMIFLSLFLVFNRCCKQNMIQFIPGSIGLISFCYIFYSSKKNNYDIEINPFSIIFIIIAIPLLIIIVTFFFRQTKLILLGINTKQFISIGSFITNKDNSIKSVNKKYAKLVYPDLIPLSFREKFDNLKNIICRKREKSLVYLELERILNNKN